jgi:transposase
MPQMPLNARTRIGARRKHGAGAVGPAHVRGHAPLAAVCRCSHQCVWQPMGESRAGALSGSARSVVAVVAGEAMCRACDKPQPGHEHQRAPRRRARATTAFLLWCGHAGIAWGFAQNLQGPAAAPRGRPLWGRLLLGRLLQESPTGGGSSRKAPLGAAAVGACRGFEGAGKARVKALTARAPRAHALSLTRKSGWR